MTSYCQVLTAASKHNTHTLKAELLADSPGLDVPFSKFLRNWSGQVVSLQSAAQERAQCCRSTHTHCQSAQTVGCCEIWILRAHSLCA